MADRSPAPDTPELRERWGSFEFTEAWAAKADAAVTPVRALVVASRECGR